MRTMRTLPIVFVLSLAAAVTVSADQPCMGTMDLQFNLGWPGPQVTIPDWVGTITIDGQEYGMAFFAIGSGKAFVSNPSGSVHFFQEIWVIYDELEFEFDENGVLVVFEPGPLLLKGYDTGITNLVNSKYHMVGNVEEANGTFSTWASSNVYMRGIIEWYPIGAPRSAPGIFRMN